jgi:hypothetical protein
MLPELSALAVFLIVFGDGFPWDQPGMAVLILIPLPPSQLGLKVFTTAYLCFQA